MKYKIIQILNEIGLSGIIDITFMAMLIYTGLLWFKRAKAASVLSGIIIIGVVYLFSKQFNLYLTQSVFQQFFAVILIVVVVIFQEELKRFFEKIALWSFEDRNLRMKKLLKLSRNEVEILVQTITELSRERIGALIVIKGKEPLLRQIYQGVELEGKLSGQILRSIFDPNSPGHDGAVIIEGNKVSQFSCRLPLSKNFQKLQKLGTRHAAALGLTELTDALCIVVSEERGTISFSREEEIQQINDPEKLTAILERFYREISPESKSRTFVDYLRKNSKEKILALLITLSLWFVLVHESKITYKEFNIPVEHAELSPELVLQEITPGDLKITFSAPRKNFYFFDKNEIMVLLKIRDPKEGTETISVNNNTEVLHPQELSLIKVEPRYIKINIASKESIKKQEEIDEKK